jgi:hypothetical protein
MDEQQQQTVIAAEDATPDDQLSPEARKRKEARFKKRVARAKEKQQKVAQAEAKKVEQFENIAAMERHNALAHLCVTMRDFMDGRFEVLDDEDREWLAEADAQVQAAVQQHGTTTADFVILSYTSERCLYDIVGAPASEGDTALTALPERLVREWNQWLQDRESSWVEQAVQQSIQPVEESIMLRCEGAGCSHPGRAIPRSLVNRYRELKIPYLCHNCLVVGQRSAAQASINVLAKTSAERKTIFDNYGRLRDQ